MEGNTVSDIVALMVQMNKPHWWICHYHDAKHIAESPKKDNLDLDEATATLRNTVKHLPTGRYKIQISDYPKGNNNRGDVSHLSFQKNEMDGTPPASVQGFSYDMIGQLKADMEKQFEERLKASEERMKREHEIAELRREIKELKEERQGGISGFLGTDQGQQLIGLAAQLGSIYLAKALGIAPAQEPAQEHTSNPNLSQYKPV